MPPAKNRPPPQTEDSRSEVSSVRERQIAAAAHARKSKQANGAAAVAAAANAARESGSALKELALVSAEAGGRRQEAVAPGMSWHTAPLSLLNTYRVAHSLPTPPAFTTPLRQALLSNGGIGKFSPTMARRREKRRVGREQLATSVRKHFNGAAVNETDVVVEMVYRVRNRDKAFRMRSAPGTGKK